MAPEVLLQAGRYLAADGMAKSVLDDHMLDPTHLPKVPSAILLEAAYSDFKRGWGVKADVWSWACSTMSLLLRTIPSEGRPSSNSICAFDFCFDQTEDALEPLHELHSSNDSLPRFHHWARMYPLRIMSVLHCGVTLPDCASVLSSAMQRILVATFRQQDQRPSASLILHILEAALPSKTEAEIKGVSCNSSLYSVTPHSVDLHPSSTHARSSGSLTSAFAHPEDAHNIDLSGSNAISASLSMNPEGVARYYPSQQSFVMLDSPPPKKREIASSTSLSPSAALTAQQKFFQNRLIHSPIASPGLYSAGITVSSSPSRRPAPPQTLSSAAAAMELSPSVGSTALSPSVSSAALSPSPHTVTLPSPVHPASTLTQSGMNNSSAAQRHMFRSSALLDEVFLQAFEQEEKQMSPVPPLPPTAKVRQMDSMTIKSNSSQWNVSSSGGRSTSSKYKALPPSPGWDREDPSRLKPKLSFPNLRPRRESIVTRLAAHFTRRPSNPALSPLTSRRGRGLEDEEEDESMDDAEQSHQRPPPSMLGLYNNDPFGPPRQDPHRGNTLDSDGDHNALSNEPVESPKTKSRGASTASRGEMRSKKTSQGVLGLGIDFGRPLRSVRSFTSYRDPTTPTQASQPQINPAIVMGASSSAMADDNDASSLRGQDFLLYDPYAIDSAAAAAAAAHNASTSTFSLSNRPYYPPSLSQQQQSVQASLQQQQQKRVRSWSSIFKRKKE
jgi:hypothetical protein